MTQRYQDAMAIVGTFGKPDIFLTFTCNPYWREVVENLQPNQTPMHRPDLVSRVFQLKLKRLLKDISKNHIFGLPCAHVHVIEFQVKYF